MRIQCGAAIARSVKRDNNGFSGIGVQERGCPRLPEDAAVLAALPFGPRPGTVERHGAAVPSPTHRMRSAWRGAGAASRRAMYRGWPARYAGPPRLGLLFGAVEVHLALGPLLLLGAGPLGIKKACAP